jgi:hypothetical protein
MVAIFVGKPGWTEDAISAYPMCALQIIKLTRPFELQWHDSLENGGRCVV